MDMLLPLVGIVFFFLMLSLVVAITRFSASPDSKNASDREGEQTKVSRIDERTEEKRHEKAA